MIFISALDCGGLGRRIPQMGAVCLMLALAGCAGLTRLPEPAEQEEVSVSETQAAGQSGAVAASGAEADSGGLPQSEPVNPYLLNRTELAPEVLARFQRAVTLVETQQWQQAEEQLRALSRSYPGLSGPYLNLGIVYQAQQRIEQAEAAYLEAIAANPDNLDAYNQLAVLLRRQGRFDAAERYYLDALKRWNADPAIHLNLAMLYELYMGQLDLALQHYQRHQELLAQPDPKVAGWIVDLERRIDQIAMSN